jgi:capsid protein
MSLADLLKLDIKSPWTDGEFINQIVTDFDEPGPIKTKLKAVQSRRLATPPKHAATTDVVLGVKRNRLGRPISYFLAEYQILGVFEQYTGRFVEVPARDLIHEFIVLEPGQARGQPWLTTSLQPTADMRDYDAQVLDAARQAADYAVALYTDHPDAEYLKVNEIADIERRQIQTMPPGWKPQALQPPQPATNYVDYRSERQRDVGRPVGMPLMTVRLDSSKHNYSSARFDAQVYRRGITALRGWLRRRKILRLVNIIKTEAELYAQANPLWELAKILRRRPKNLRYLCVWQAFPHVDDEKEANGQRMRMEDATLTFSGACLENGQDPDAVVDQLQLDTKKLAAIGIVAPWLRNSQSQPTLPQPSEELAAAADAEGIDLATAMQAQKTGRQMGSMQTAVALNGAQILAAVDVMNKLREGALVATAATELLVAVGIDRPKAEGMVKATPLAEKDSSADKEFLRNLVEGLLTNPTSAAALANAINRAELLKQTGAPVNAGYVDPMLPIVAPAGQLVSGEMIKDAKGNIIGAGVLPADDATDGDAAGNAPQVATPAADGDGRSATPAAAVPAAAGDGGSAA